MSRRELDLIFHALLFLTLVDRAILLGVFAFNYTGSDDAVICSAAVDYGQGRFHEPYFYAQDYAPMLEALIAAPFTWLHVPVHILLPLVTCVLAMFPYWSFAFWHRRRQEPGMACLFLAIPLLLPPEYGLMTSMTRGFVTGIALVGLLPWVLNARREERRSLLTGLVVSAACFFNPNVLPFVIAYTCWFLFTPPIGPRRILLFTLATLPAILVQVLAQAYCRAHPERMHNVLFDWRMDFHAAGIAEAFGRLDLHFAWLTPLLWPWGQLIGEALVLLLLVHAWKRRWPMAIGLIAAVALIIFSFGFGKTHQGDHDAFYPYARMFLVLPVLFGWALAPLVIRIPNAAWWMRGLLLASVVALLAKSLSLPAVLAEQLAGINPVVSERRVDLLHADAAEIAGLCAAHDIGLVLLLPEHTAVPAQFRSLTHPLMNTRLPPTYFGEQDCRYWVKAAFGDSAVQAVLLIGTAEGALLSGTAPRGPSGLLPSSGDRFVVLKDNDRTVDDLCAQVMGRAIDHSAR